MMVPIAPETVPQRMEVALGPAAAASPLRGVVFMDTDAEAEADAARVALVEETGWEEDEAAAAAAAAVKSASWSAG